MAKCARTNKKPPRTQITKAQISEKRGQRIQAEIKDPDTQGRPNYPHVNGEGPTSKQSGATGEEKEITNKTWKWDSVTPRGRARPTNANEGERNTEKSRSNRQTKDPKGEECTA